ncbi:PQQ-binding-like beta-propeller repeat protein [Bremerella sp. P1]|uniref:PQQ-binding-like beta-propeller repeat protein n=1 Tax=Bremerella sp. P1 TaxID=3026424 RepID=UPI0023686E82|nr:PQQ-binding-like beta-propeller repeat protein [Bremerella sp. P1]WDI41545.1 hypothetical protein PSR63_24075 [Bremerella sp. P1]
MPPIRLLAVFALALVFPAENIASAEKLADWPKWRGPDDTGSSPLVGLPIEWNAENVLWKTELSRKGCSTPIVWQNTIYVSAPIISKDALIALDANGKPLWNVQFGSENLLQGAEISPLDARHPWYAFDDSSHGRTDQLG